MNATTNDTGAAAVTELLRELLADILGDAPIIGLAGRRVTQIEQNDTELRIQIEDLEYTITVR